MGAAAAAFPSSAEVKRPAPGTVLWSVCGLVVLLAVGVEVTRPLAGPVTPVDVATTGLGSAAIDAAREYRDGLLPLSVASRLLRLAVGGVVFLPPVRRRMTTVVQGIVERRELAGRRAFRPLIAGVLGMAVWAVADVIRLPVQLLAWRRSVAVGLSTQDAAGWLRDYVVVAVPYWLGVGVVVATIAWLMRRLPRTWAPTAGLSVGLAGVALLVISPLVLEPLLLSFSDLRDGDLRDDIQRLAVAELGEPVDAVLVADASRRTTASNAYVSGLGSTRRIVLYDTLLRDAPPEEVLAIVAHELAHRANHDVARTALDIMATSVVGFALMAAVRGSHLRDPQGRVRPDMAVPLVGLTIILAVLVAPLGSWVSRRAESAADQQAVAITGDPQAFSEMMIGLAERNLSDPDPPAWVVALWYSHPPLAERLGRGMP